MADKILQTQTPNTAIKDSQEDYEGALRTLDSIFKAKVEDSQEDYEGALRTLDSIFNTSHGVMESDRNPNAQAWIDEARKTGTLAQDLYNEEGEIVAKKGEEYPRNPVVNYMLSTSDEWTKQPAPSDAPTKVGPEKLKEILSKAPKQDVNEFENPQRSNRPISDNLVTQDSTKKYEIAKENIDPIFLSSDGEISSDGIEAPESWFGNQQPVNHQGKEKEYTEKQLQLKDIDVKIDEELRHIDTQLTNLKDKVKTEGPKLEDISERSYYWSSERSFKSSKNKIKNYLKDTDLEAKPKYAFIEGLWDALLGGVETAATLGLNDIKDVQLKREVAKKQRKRNEGMGIPSEIGEEIDNIPALSDAQKTLFKAMLLEHTIDTVIGDEGSEARRVGELTGDFLVFMAELAMGMGIVKGGAKQAMTLVSEIAMEVGIIERTSQAVATTALKSSIKAAEYEALKSMIKSASKLTKSAVRFGNNFVVKAAIKDAPLMTAALAPSVTRDMVSAGTPVFDEGGNVHVVEGKEYTKKALQALAMSYIMNFSMKLGEGASKWAVGKFEEVNKGVFESLTKGKTFIPEHAEAAYQLGRFINNNVVSHTSLFTMDQTSKILDEVLGLQPGAFTKQDMGEFGDVLLASIISGKISSIASSIASRTDKISLEGKMQKASEMLEGTIREVYPKISNEDLSLIMDHYTRGTMEVGFSRIGRFLVQVGQYYTQASKKKYDAEVTRLKKELNNVITNKYYTSQPLEVREWKVFELKKQIENAQKNAIQELKTIRDNLSFIIDTKAEYFAREYGQIATPIWNKKDDVVSDLYTPLLNEANPQEAIIIKEATNNIRQNTDEVEVEAHRVKRDQVIDNIPGKASPEEVTNIISESMTYGAQWVDKAITEIGYDNINANYENSRQRLADQLEKYHQDGVDTESKMTALESMNGNELTARAITILNEVAPEGYKQVLDALADFATMSRAKMSAEAQLQPKAETTAKAEEQTKRNEDLAHLESLASENGTIYPITLANGTGYIKKGNIVLDKDGKLDRGASSKEIYYIDNEGNMQVADINTIALNLQDPMLGKTPQELVDAAHVAGVDTPINIGETATYMDMMGKAHTSKVVDMDEMGNVVMENGDIVSSHTITIHQFDYKYEDGALVTLANGSLATILRNADGTYTAITPQGKMPVMETDILGEYVAPSDTPQEPTTTTPPSDEVATPQVEAPATPEIPTTPEGPVDYDALLMENPSAFIEAYNAEFGGGANEVIKETIRDTENALVALEGKLSEGGLTINERAQAQRDIATLKDKIAKMESIVEYTPEEMAIKNPMSVLDASPSMKDAQATLNKAKDILNAELEKLSKSKKADKEQQISDITSKKNAIDKALLVAGERIRATREEQEKALQAKAEEQIIETPSIDPGIAKIKAKWDSAKKIEGNKDEIVLPNGETLSGKYIMTEAGAATPSHDPMRNFAKSEGFPTTDEGTTVNDRDYEKDKTAQALVEKRSQSYDQRAVINPVVVSQDGIVLSGNDRTMSGNLAAENGTDSQYVDYLKQFGNKYGFALEQVSEFEHPRVVFVPDEALPYTTEVFAKFNAQETKSQNKTESAVKIGKTISEQTTNKIVNVIAKYETMKDVLESKASTDDIVNILVSEGMLGENEVAEMFDNGNLSAVGRDYLETIFLGMVLTEEGVRMTTEYPMLRRSVLNAIPAMANNRRLPNSYDLQNEIQQAITTLYRAHKSGVKQGESIVSYLLQPDLFTGKTSLQDAVSNEFAQRMNSRSNVSFRNTLIAYNEAAEGASRGQVDAFLGVPRSKEEIMSDLISSAAKFQLSAPTPSRGVYGAELTGHPESVFMSNAMIALNTIKQNKATGAQWLAMLQKAGGIKAGEDKWTGLSEWLTENKDNSLTREDIAKYITENGIKLEEVQYGNSGDMDYEEQLEAFNQEFEELMAEGEEATNSIYSADWANYAYQKMAEQYGEDFMDAIEIDQGYGRYPSLVLTDTDELSKSAQRLFGYEEGVKAINNTRLSYTTEGLDNKKELAFVVPTIAPWNVNDNIHFGDAGEGRNIGWVRFGDASALKEVAISTDVSLRDPYKNYKGENVYPDSRNNKNYVIERQGKYGLFINEKYSGRMFDSLKDAEKGLQEHYSTLPPTQKATPVLVIDEIQSNRHQQGREKGYNAMTPQEEARYQEIVKELQVIGKEAGDISMKIVDILFPAKAYNDILVIRKDSGAIEEMQRDSHNKEVYGQLLHLYSRQFYTTKREVEGIIRAVEAIRSYISERKQPLVDEFLEIMSQRDMNNLDALYLKEKELEQRKQEIITGEEWTTLNQKKRGIPTAPFEKNWMELIAKRMLRYATENGYEHLAWTTGRQQGERYNFSTVVDEIKLVKSVGDRYQFEGYKDGYSVYDQTLTRSEIIELVGKQKAEEWIKVADEVYEETKHLHTPDEETDEAWDEYNKKVDEIDRKTTHTGEDLSIGDEGMKGFYDIMLPSFLDKYCKKWGTKVESIFLPTINKEMHSIAITPEMRESVMKPQPLFQIPQKTFDIIAPKVKTDKVEKLVDRLKSTGLAKDVVIVKTESELLDKFDIADGVKATVRGRVAAATDNKGNIVICEENMRMDTAFHEFCHKLYSYARANKKENVLRGLRKIADSAPEHIKKFVQETYPELGVEAYLEEVYAWHTCVGNQERLKSFLAERGIDKRTSSEQLQDYEWYKNIADEVERLFKLLKDAYTAENKVYGVSAPTLAGYADLSVFDSYEDMSSDQLIEAVYDVLMNGKRLSMEQEIQGVAAQVSPNSLVAVHNITQEKLINALKLGGLANPSVATFDSSRARHEGFGEISLVLPSEKLEGVTTFSRDAWTPKFPGVEYSFSEKAQEQVKDLISKIEDQELRQGVQYYLSAYLNGQGPTSSPLGVLFLQEKGIPFTPKRQRGYYSEGMHSAAERIFKGKVTPESYNNLSPEEKVEFFLLLKGRLNQTEIDRGNYTALLEGKIKNYEERIKELEDSSEEHKETMIKFVKERLGRSQALLDLAKEADLTSDVMRMESDRNSTPGIDTYGSFDEAEKVIIEHNLLSEFKDWQEDMLDNIIKPDKVFFSHWTPSGNRVYKPYTLEEVSKWMKKQGLNASDFGNQTGMEYFLSHMVKKMKGRSAIRKNRSRLVSNDEAVKWSTEVSEIYHDAFWGIINDGQLPQRYSNDYIVAENVAFETLKEIVINKRPIESVEKEYKVTLSPTTKDAIESFASAAKNAVDHYFETKFQRPLYFDEFAVAVVPIDTKESIKKQLRDMGVEVKEYDPNLEGHRADVLDEAIRNRNDIAFQLIGERGAQNFDAHEETTTRMDNLSIARKMEQEGKDVSNIRYATGWERGADGKWRYEIVDDFSMVELPIDKYKTLKKEFNVLQDQYDRLNYRIPSRVPSTASQEEKDRVKALRKERDTKFREKSNKWIEMYNAERAINFTGLMDLLGESHPIFKAYPTLRRMEVSFSPERYEYINNGYSGAYNGRYIWVSPWAKDPMGTLAHETQHAIQEIEGFARGGNQSEVKTKAFRLYEDASKLYDMMDNSSAWNERLDLIEELGKDNLPEKRIQEITDRLQVLDKDDSVKEIMSLQQSLGRKYGNSAPVSEILSKRTKWEDEVWNELFPNFHDPYEAYRSLAGEVEARNVTKRINMTAEERREKILKETEDVYRDDQVVLLEGNYASANANKNEIDAIVDKAKYSGTYLQAPNGKESNLSTLPNTWAQIRTVPFKEWFGNWEKIAQRNFLCNGKAVANLSGNEFSPVKNKTLTDLVAEYFKQIGGIAVSPFIGKVLLDKAGADDSLAHGMGRRKAIAYASVKEVIENGIIIGFDRNHKDRGYNSVVFAAPINISNERFICYVVVKINQKENRFYLHEVWAEKNLTNVRSNTAQKQPSHLQGNAKVIENILNAKNNASKILDENGEPLIVYHGSGQWFEEFKPDAPKHSGAPNGAYYFTDNKEIANSFVPGKWYGVSRGEKSGMAKEVVLDPNSPMHPQYNWGTYREGGIYSVFLNMRNPLEVDFKGNLWKDNGKGESIDDIVHKAQEEGKYDGVIIKNVKDVGHSDIPERNIPVSTVYVTFKPEQTKSATQNEGGFSNENPKLRFRTSTQLFQDYPTWLSEQPTEAQKKAGNYKMEHIRRGGYNISIENPKGSVRRGTDKDGNTWANTMPADYGYIRGTVGKDGDHIDVFVGPIENPREIYVVDQINPETGMFDESKVMYGFSSIDEANQTYHAAYDKGWKGMQTITAVSKETFDAWVESSTRKNKPFAEYSQVKGEVIAQQEGILSEYAKTATKAAKALGGEIEVITDAKEITDATIREKAEKGKIKGWYDPKTGKTYIVIPNAESVEDVERTVLHENLGHRNLTEMLGDEADAFFAMVWRNMPRDVKAKARREKVDRKEAAEEYVAEIAETYTKPSVWNRIASYFKALLRKWGFRIKMTDAEIRYYLYKAAKYGKTRDLISETNVKASEYNLKRAYEAQKKAKEDVKYRFVGEKGAKRVDGVASTEQIALIDNLRKAKEMAEKGVAPEKILSSTGWMKGKDGMWRIERSDIDLRPSLDKAVSEALTMRDGIAELAKRETSELDLMNAEAQFQEKYGVVYNVAEASKQEIAKAMMEMGVSVKPMLEGHAILNEYPELGEWRLKITDFLPQGTMGSTDQYTKTILLNASMFRDYTSSEIDNVRGIILHELQHIIQYYEGFAPGGSTVGIVGYKKDLTKKIDIACEGAVTSKGSIVDFFGDVEMVDRYQSTLDEVAKENGMESAEDMYNFLTEDAIDSYANLAGEVEARRVEARMDMTPEEIKIVDKAYVDAMKRSRALDVKTPMMDEVAPEKDVKDPWTSRSYRRMHLMNEVDRIMSESNSKMSEGMKRHLVVQYIKLFITKNDMLNFGKGDLIRLLSIVEKAPTKRDFHAALSNVYYEVARFGYQQALRKVRAMKEMKIEGEKNGISVAKNVDQTAKETMRTFKDLTTPRSRSMVDPIASIQAHIHGGSNTEYGGLEAEIMSLTDKIAMYDSPDLRIHLNDAMAKLAGCELAIRYHEVLDARDVILQTQKDIERELAELNAMRRRFRAEGGIKPWDKARFDARIAKVNEMKNALSEEISDLADRMDDIAKELHEVMVNGIENLNNELIQRETERLTNISRAIESIGGVKYRSIELTKKEKLKELAANVWIFDSRTIFNLNNTLRFISMDYMYGESPMWRYYIEKAIEASNTFYERSMDGARSMDEKVVELFKLKWADVVVRAKNTKTGATITLKPMTEHVETPEGRKPIPSDEPSQTIDLSVDAALYILGLCRNPEVAKRYKDRGIDEAELEKIEDAIRRLPNGNKYMALLDWIQYEFLPKTREVYNVTHRLLNGSNIKYTANYLPLRINKTEQTPKEDALAGLINVARNVEETGHIKNRKSTQAVPSLTQGILEYLPDYILSMEEWNAYSLYGRQVNDILGSRVFRNSLDAKLPGMRDILREAFQVSSGAYVPLKSKDKTAAKAVEYVRSRVVGSNIAFNLIPAIKQFLSYPSVFDSYNTRSFYKKVGKYVMPQNYLYSNLKWMLEGYVPGLKKRWEEGFAGYNELKSMESGFIVTPILNKARELVKEKGDVMDMATNFAFFMKNKFGMAPNRVVDVLTCAAIARPVYEETYERAKKKGMTDEEAKKEAEFRATVVFNQSQQSGERWMTSAIQNDSSLQSLGTTTYQNTNIQQQALLQIATAELEKGADKERREKAIALRAKEYSRKGMNEEKAQKEAKKDFKESQRKAAINVFLYGYFLKFIWAWGGIMFQHWLLSGEDEEKYVKEPLRNPLTYILQGLLQGKSYSTLINFSAGFLSNYMPIKFGDTMLQDWINQQTKALRDEDADLMDKAFAVANMVSVMDTGNDINKLRNMFLSFASFPKVADKEGSGRDLLLQTLNLSPSQRKRILMQRLPDESFEDYQERVSDVAEVLHAIEVKEDEIREKYIEKRLEDIAEEKGELDEYIADKIYIEENLKKVAGLTKSGTVADVDIDRRTRATHMQENKELVQLLRRNKGEMRRLTLKTEHLSNKDYEEIYSVIKDNLHSIAILLEEMSE